jgi:hypothetical protein
MKSNVKALSPEELIPPLLELLKETDCVPLVISGSSMTPFLVHHRDTVYLSRIHRPLQRGDMILYRRDNGRYILHRIYRAEPDGYTLVGDAQTALEHGIRPDQILALVSAVRRKGRYLGPGSFWWLFFRHIWIRMVPIRPWILSIYSGVTQLF